MFNPTAARSWVCSAAVSLVAFLALTVWVQQTNGPTGLDTAVMSFVLAARTPLLTALASTATVLGSVPAVIIVAVVAAVVLLRRTERLLLPLTLLIVVAETASVVFLTKAGLGRQRPPIDWLIGTPSSDASYPSGHTTNGTVVYVLAALFLCSTITRHWVRRLLLVAAVAVSVSIGLSRVYLGHHWTTDVLGAWLLATASCSVAAFVVCRLSAKTYSAGQHQPETGREIVSR